MRIQRSILLPRNEFVKDSPLFIVAVEGEKREKQYLNLFQSKRAKIEVLSTDRDGKSAPEYVLERLAQFQAEHEGLQPTDEFWIVLDMDRWSVHDVLQVARASGYMVAISNPCFEVWLILHFEECNHPGRDCQPLKQRVAILTRGQMSRSVYARENVVRAIDSAKKLERTERARFPNRPGTHMYKLIEKLLPYWPVAGYPE